MEIQASPIAGPHTHAKPSMGFIMRQVIYALIPITLFSFYVFGWPIVNLWFVAVITAIITEAIALLAFSKPLKNLLDGSAILTGWLVALTLPPWAPWWIAVIGVSFAIIIGKQIFGGIGQNVFNPAMLARTMLLIAFPVEMTTWILPHAQVLSFSQGLEITFLNNFAIDSFTSASPLGHLKTELTLGHSAQDIIQQTSFMDSILGFIVGSIGEISALLILISGFYLLWRKIITWHIPVSILLTIWTLGTFFSFLDANQYASGSFHLLHGAIFFAAFFIATDPVTAPVTARGQIIFGIGIGFITFVIRTWGSFPEGVGFAVLLMNAFTPLIDHYIRPRIYGRNVKGKPLKQGDKI